MGFHELTPDRFQIVQHIFDTENHLAIVAALAGETPAELYVDDPIAPHAALMIVLNKRIFLAGTPYDTTFAHSFATLLLQRHTPVASDSEPVERTIAYAPDSWAEVLPTLFANIETYRMDRLCYRLRLNESIAPPIPPEDFLLRQIDAALIAESGHANHHLLMQELHSEAPSIEDFLRNRFGYCLQYGQEIVAWCLSEYNHGDRCELGIETLSAFRRRGLAMLTAKATLTHAQANGITTVGWHCWKHNVASSALAQKLDFELVEEYPVWYCRFARQSTTENAPRLES